MESRVSARGQTVIPAEIRRKLGLKAGARLWWAVYEEGAIVVALPQDSVRGASGMLEGYDINSAVVLEERRKDRESEERHEAEVLLAAVRS
jgi:antitoxin PrlF